MTIGKISLNFFFFNLKEQCPFENISIKVGTGKKKYFTLLIQVLLMRT